MHIKSLTLENFKSFHKRTVISFEKGFTSITGPNGSGKSNLSDAIIFVLGQKGSRALRAQKMSDLIFNGGEKKEPATSAYVSLVFDNKNREIPIDSNEVEITRTVKKSYSKEEDYTSSLYINNKKITYTELESLLLHAMINVDNYNIVQQGDITNIIEIGSKERRKIIDTISGIAVYDDELLKAEEKKKVIEENLTKIEILITELKDREKTLFKDKQEAEKYVAIANKLEDEKVALRWKDYLQQLNKIKKVNEQIAEIENEVGKLAVEIGYVENELKAKEDYLNEVTGNLSEKNRYINEVTTTQYNKDLVEEAKLNERKEGIEIQLKELASNIKKGMAEIEKRKNVIKSFEIENKNFKIELEKNRTILVDVNNELNNTKNVLYKNSSEFNAMEKNRIVLEKELERITDKIAMLKVRIEEIKKENEKRVIERSKLDEELKRVKFELQDREKFIREVSIDKMEAENKKKKEQFYSLRAEISSVEDKLRSLETKMKEIARERGKLEGRKEFLGVRDGTEALLSLRNSRTIEGIIGTIGELVTIDEKYKKALFSAVGNRLNSIVVKDENVATQCISYLKENRLGRTTFLPLSKLLDGMPRGKAIMISKNEHSLGFLIDLIKFDKDYRKAIWYAVGDTVLMDALENAKVVMGGVRIVTLDGDLIEPSGAMIGGYIEKVQIGKNTVATELEVLLSELKQLDNEKASLVARKGELESLIESTENELEKSVSLIEKYKEKNNNTVKEITNFRNAYNNGMAQIKLIDDELQHYEDELKKIEEVIEDLNRQHEQKMAELNKLKEGYLKTAPKELSKKIGEYEKRRIEMETRINQLNTEIVKLTSNIDNENKRITELEKEANNNTLIVDTKKKELISVMDNMSAVKNRLESYTQLLSTLNDEAKKLGETITLAKNELNNLSRKRIEIKEKIEGKKLVAETLKADLSNIIEEIKGIEKDLTVDIKDEYKDVTRDIIEKDVATDEKLLKEMGNVNLKAIEEYADVKKRVDEFDRSIEKLKIEMNDIRNIEKTINKEKKGRFIQVFEEVNKNFKELYNILSGGEAELVIENYSAPFEGGLLIKAKPVGKKVQRIEALSGGEKSLTALTFIMAIQKYLPSPFYILDEVDMFLDAVNAEKIAKTLKGLSKNTQILIISLRKATLKEADSILGITQIGTGESIVIKKDLSYLKGEEVDNNSTATETQVV